MTAAGDRDIRFTGGAPDAAETAAVLAALALVLRRAPTPTGPVPARAAPAWEPERTVAPRAPAIPGRS